ncbi:MAG: endonuclease/exonuclease/phosphatase family protein [Myxococcales bacterium]|nr:endonuclease/exonuclease/phosphatase family protein [Myxococcales bacterium]
MGWLAACGPAPRQPELPTPGEPHLSVLSYNLNFGLGGDPAGIEAIRRSFADLVLLQETTPEWEEALRRELSDRYPHMAFRHCCRAGGLGVLSRFELDPREYIESDTGWFPAWRVLASTPLGTLQLLDVHLHPAVSESGSVVSGYFTTPPLRRAEIERFFPALDPGLPTLVAGDFNEGRSGGAVGFLEERGFRSALSEFDAPSVTWRWDLGGDGIALELDHILHDAALEPLDCRPVPLGRSDHYPVYAVFRLRRTPAPMAGSGRSTL